MFLQVILGKAIWSFLESLSLPITSRQYLKVVVGVDSESEMSDNSSNEWPLAKLVLPVLLALSHVAS